MTHSLATGVAGAVISEREFTPLWVDCNQGVLTIGTGSIPGQRVSLRWSDPQGPIPNLQHVGLSAWDAHVSYRSMRVLPPCNAALLALQPAAKDRRPSNGGGGGGISGRGGDGCESSSGEGGTLLGLCHAQLMAQCESAASVLGVLSVAELLLPNTQKLYCHCLEQAALHFADLGAAAAAIMSDTFVSCHSLEGLEAGTAGQTGVAAMEAATAGELATGAHKPATQMGRSVSRFAAYDTHQSRSSSTIASLPDTGHHVLLQALSPSVIADLLGQTTFAIREKAIFDIVLIWANSQLQGACIPDSPSTAATAAADHACFSKLTPGTDAELHTHLGRCGQELKVQAQHRHRSQVLADNGSSSSGSDSSDDLSQDGDTAESRVPADRPTASVGDDGKLASAAELAVSRHAAAAQQQLMRDVSTVMCRVR